MAVGGVGGLLGNLFNPGLDDRLAQHITPNPNPLAQQGGPPGPKDVDSLGNPVPAQQPNLAPAAVTQPDPVNSSYARDLLAASRRDANAQMFNEGMDQMTASFGTAQQQQSKQQALRHGGGVGGSLADLATIQGMQEKTIADNEQARFMANAHAFGETLRAQGINVTDAQATEIMNGGKEMRDQFSGAAAGAGQSNATLTGTTKDVDQAMKSWAAAHPEATTQEINDHRAGLLEQQVGGQDPATKAMNNALRVWSAQPENKGKLPPDYLTDPIKYKAYAESTVGTAEIKAKDLVADQRNYTPAARTIDEQIKDAKDLLNSKGFNDIYGGAVNAGKTLDGPGAALLGDDTKEALSLQNKLISGQYTSQIQDMHGMGRITQSEMERGSPAQSTVAKRAISVETARQGWQDWITKQETKKANFAGAAGQLDQLSDEEYKLVNPIYKPGGELYVPGQRVRVEQKDDGSSAPADSKVKRRHYNEKGELVD